MPSSPCLKAIRCLIRCAPTAYRRDTGIMRLSETSGKNQAGDRTDRSLLSMQANQVLHALRQVGAHIPQGYYIRQLVLVKRPDLCRLDRLPNSGWNTTRQLVVAKRQTLAGWSGCPIRHRDTTRQLVVPQGLSSVRLARLPSSAGILPDNSLLSRDPAHVRLARLPSSGWRYFPTTRCRKRPSTLKLDEAAQLGGDTTRQPVAGKTRGVVRFVRLPNSAGILPVNWLSEPRPQNLAGWSGCPIPQMEYCPTTRCYVKPRSCAQVCEAAQLGGDTTRSTRCWQETQQCHPAVAVGPDTHVPFVRAACR